MTIKAGHYSLYSHDIYIFFILVNYQTGLWEKYFVTGDWSQSIGIVILYEARLVP